MRKFQTALIGSIILSQSLGISYAQKLNNKSLPTTIPQKLGYALGIGMGRSLKKMAPDIEFDSLLHGIKDSYNGLPLSIDEAEAAKIKAEFIEKRVQKNKFEQRQKHLIQEEDKKTIQEKAMVKPSYSLDLSMVDQTTADHAAWSFAILYNDIMPIYGQKQLDKICHTMATIDFNVNCVKLLQARLAYLKKNIKVINKAIFTNPQIVKRDYNGNNYELSWDETFTSPAGKQTFNHKKLHVQLTQTSKWQISSAYFKR